MGIVEYIFITTLVIAFSMIVVTTTIIATQFVHKDSNMKHNCTSCHHLLYCRSNKIYLYCITAISVGIRVLSMRKADAETGALQDYLTYGLEVYFGPFIVRYWI